jgi:hypothetical protein
MALNCINQELSAFHEWQTLINAESKFVEKGNQILTLTHVDLVGNL